ncbi:Fc.00g010620.m01.CDS01 [Cosmosporella sp. VM-42]
METLWRLLGVLPPKAPPAPVETDDIYPLHMLDDTKTLRDIVVTWTLRFNDVLDADKLHVSLSRLLEIGDWRKVGGRLRLNEKGELEIHVPRPFTAERPAVSYSYESLAVAIEDHPLAKTLPRATGSPSIQPGPPGFRAFAAREDAPAVLDDFIFHDTPQLSLHITSFTNATLVALSWPHTLMDVMGQQALLHAWSLVLAGRESDVAPVLGAREDAICKAADAPVEMEEFKLARKQLTGWSMFMFGLRFAWDMLCNSVVETRTVFLPQKFVADLRRQAESDLAAVDGGEKNRFVSDGDVLTAWAAHAVASSLPQPRPVTVLHALNARFRLSSLVQASGVYIQNMAVAAFTFLSAEVAMGPLGTIALENRRHLMEQATEGQVLSILRELRGQSKTDSDPRMLCGDSDAVLLPFTNWTRADIFKAADFGHAVVCAGETTPERGNPPGTMVFHHAQSMRPSAGARNIVVVLGKDHSSNYWLTGLLLPSAWAVIEKELETA